MEESKKNAIRDKLIAVFEKSMSVWRDRGLMTVAMDDSILELLLEEDGWVEKFSEKFLGNKINNIIIKMVLEDKSSLMAANYLDEMIHELDSFSIEQVLYIPLIGIEKPHDKIVLGNVTINLVDAAKANGLIEKVSTDTYEIDRINKYIKEHVCAEFHCVAEPIRALELAEEETRRAIDLIRYAIPALYSRDARVIVGLHGEFCYSYRYVPIDPIGKKSFASEGKFTGPLYDFEFSEENIKKMNRIGINKLSGLLQKDKISDFEEKLLSSIHWFANSQVKIENEDKLLNLITCLEIFFTPPQSDRDPILQNVAEGAALLIGESVEQKKAIIEDIRKLYSLRSSLSHHGKGIVLDLDVRILTEIDYAVLSTLINKIDEFNDPSKSAKSRKQRRNAGKGKSKKDKLQKWIEYTRLGGSPEKWDEYSGNQCDKT
jgi:hypothetical protein